MSEPEEKKPKKLTEKEKLFCKEYVANKFNAKKAAELAGYSKDTAKQIGYENLTKPYLQEEIARITGPIFEKLEISAERVGQELAAIAYARINELGEWDEDGKLTVKTVKDIPDHLLGAIQSVEKVVSQQGNRFKIKFHDKTKALEMLAKHTKFYEEPIEGKGPVTNNNFLGSLPTDKLRRIVEIMNEPEGGEDGA